MKISGVIITFNEEEKLEKCLNSLQSVCDELLVVDSFSTDRTKAIAEKMGARVIQRPFLGHIEQKNFAKEQAAGPWVLSLDADEALSPELITSIQKLKSEKPEFQGYRFNRLNKYCGRYIKHGNWYPDRKLRLWLRDAGQWTGENPHDRFELYKGEVGFLKGDLLHDTIQSKEEHLVVIRKYALIAAKALHQKGKKNKAWKRFVSPFAEFFGGYIFRMGFLDGALGFQISYLSAYATWLKYWQLSKL
jgi:glycosyltransferase involved in cell wall biosynthesis